MIIAIDHGNSAVKTEHTSFTAGITAHGTAKPAIPTDIVKYRGEYYTVSNKRETYKRDKTQDEKCFIMTLFALAREIIATNSYSKDSITVDLAIGLPPDHYSKQKHTFARYFYDHGAEWIFEYNSKPFSIKLKDIHIFPQAYSAIATRPSALKEYSTTYIVDIGGYTVDVLLLRDGKPDLQVCQSFEMGIIQMCNDICHRVNTEYGLKIGDTHVQDVLLDKKTTLSSEIKDFIRESAQGHTTAILNTLRESNIDLRTNPVVFMGGGSLILKDLILRSDLVASDYTEFITDVAANAVGYAVLANGIVRKNMQKQQ